MAYYLAYAMRSGAAYIIVPLAGMVLEQEDVGKFVYYLTIGNFLGTGLSMGLNSYIVRRAYSATSLRLVAVRSLVLVAMMYLPLLLVARSWSALALVVLLVGASRTASILGEAGLIGLGLRNAATWAYLAYAGVFSVVGFFGIFVVGSYQALLVGYGLAESVVFVVALLSGVFGRARVPTILGSRAILGSASNQWNALRYSLPVLLAGVFNLALASLDRIVLERYLGFAEVAAFSVMYAAAGGSNRLLLQPFNLLTTREYMRERGSREVQALIRRQTSLVLLLVTGFTVLVSLALNPLLQQLMGAEYVVDAWNYLLVGGGMLGMAGFLVNVLELKRAGKTLRFAGIFAVAAAVNVLLCFALIPRLELLGASLATLVGYWCLFFMARPRTDLISGRVVVACVATLLLVAVVV